MPYKNTQNWLHLCHCLFEVSNDVFGILDTNGEAHEVGSHTCFAQLLVRHLTVGVAGWVQHAGAGICHVGDDADEVKVVHELDGILASTLQTEGDDAT